MFGLSVRLYICAFLILTPSSSVAETLTFTTGDWRPYIFEASGTVDPARPGYSIEIVNAAFEGLGHQITYKTAPFLRQIQEVEKGTFTALAGVYQEEAPKLIFPNEAIGLTRNCFFAKPDQSWEYSGVESLLSATIAVVDGYIYGDIDDYLETGGGRVIKLIGSETDMMKRLTELVDIDRATAFVQDFAVADYFFRSAGLSGRYKAVGCLPHIEIKIGFSPNDKRSAGFSREFDVQIDKLRRTGALQTILDRYDVRDWKQ